LAIGVLAPNRIAEAMPRGAPGQRTDLLDATILLWSSFEGESRPNPDIKPVAAGADWRRDPEP